MLIFIYRKNLRPIPVHMKTVSAAVLFSKLRLVCLCAVSNSKYDRYTKYANVSRLSKLPKTIRIGR
jgi:hypothetical protein